MSDQEIKTKDMITSLVAKWHYGDLTLFLSQDVVIEA